MRSSSRKARGLAGRRSAPGGQFGVSPFSAADAPPGSLPCWINWPNVGEFLSWALAGSFSTLASAVDLVLVGLVGLVVEQFRQLDPVRIPVLLALADVADEAFRLFDEPGEILVLPLLALLLHVLGRELVGERFDRVGGAGGRTCRQEKGQKPQAPGQQCSLHAFRSFVSLQRNDRSRPPGGQHLIRPHRPAPVNRHGARRPPLRRSRGRRRVSSFAAFHSGRPARGGRCRRRGRSATPLHRHGCRCT